MSSINKFQKLLRLRTLFKNVSQLSWNVTTLEKRYPMDSLSEQETTDLIEAYREYSFLLNKANDELLDELNENNGRLDKNT